LDVHGKEENMIPLKVHNILDYVAGAFLLLCPALFGFYYLDAARYTFWVLGAGLIAYSLLTQYQYSIAKLIPVKAHMVMDVLAGIVLILAPMVLGYRGLLTSGQFALHFILGLGVIGLVSLTNTRDVVEANVITDRRTPSYTNTY
jgi:hypothetical protein